MLCKFKTEFTLEHYGITHISHPQGHIQSVSCTQVAFGESHVCISQGVHTVHPFIQQLQKHFWHMLYPHTVLKFSSEYLILFPHTHTNLGARHYIHSFSQMRKQARGSPGQLIWMVSTVLHQSGLREVLQFGEQSWIIKWLNDRKKTDR